MTKTTRTIHRVLLKCATIELARNNLTSELQEELGERVKQRCVDLVKLPIFKKHEVGYQRLRLDALAREYKKLEGDNQKLFERQFEGACREILDHLLRPGPDSKKKIEEAKIRFYERGPRKASVLYEKIEKMIKAREISTGHLGEWLSPMPVFSEKEPFGFCQATRKSRDAIREFLKTIKIKKIEQARRGRGRPPILYSVDTNLRVMEQWLGNWVEQTHDNPGWAALMTFGATIGRHARMKTEIPGTKRQKKRFHSIIRKHIKLVRAEIEDPYNQQVADDILTGPELS